MRFILYSPTDASFNPAFSDAISYVRAQAAQKNGDCYLMLPTSRIDAGKIVADLGGNIKGSFESGYRFKKKQSLLNSDKTERFINS